MSAHISHSGCPAFGWLADEGQGQAGGGCWSKFSRTNNACQKRPIRGILQGQGRRCVAHKERAAAPCRRQIETCPYLRHRLSPSIAVFGLWDFCFCTSHQVLSEAAAASVLRSGNMFTLTAGRRVFCFLAMLCVRTTSRAQTKGFLHPRGRRVDS